MVARRKEKLELGFPVDWLTRYCCKFCTHKLTWGEGGSTASCNVGLPSSYVYFLNNTLCKLLDNCVRLNWEVYHSVAWQFTHSTMHRYKTPAFFINGINLWYGRSCQEIQNKQKQSNRRFVTSGFFVAISKDSEGRTIRLRGVRAEKCPFDMRRCTYLMTLTRIR